MPRRKTTEGESSNDIPKPKRVRVKKTAEHFMAFHAGRFRDVYETHIMTPEQIVNDYIYIQSSKLGEFIQNAKPGDFLVSEETTGKRLPLGTSFVLCLGKRY